MKYKCIDYVNYVLNLGLLKNYQRVLSSTFNFYPLIFYCATCFS